VNSDLRAVIGALPLDVAVVSAAGCAGPELQPYTDLAGFGALITRSVTLEAHPGRPMPRLVETPAGLLNAIGTPGPGVAGFVSDELPRLVRTGARIIVSISATTVADFGRVAAALRHCDGISALEINISSPVLEEGVLPFAADARGAAAVVHAVRRNTPAAWPVLAKLSGDVADVPSVAIACRDAGAAAVSLINAVRGVALDTDSGVSALGSGLGGLSGPAIRPIALKAVWDVHARAPDLPILAGGGVTDGGSALSMVLAGASAVSVGSGLLNDPRCVDRVTGELDRLVGERGGSLSALIGAAHGGSETEWEAG